MIICFEETLNEISRKVNFLSEKVENVGDAEERRSMYEIILSFSRSLLWLVDMHYTERCPDLEYYLLVSDFQYDFFLFRSDFISRYYPSQNLESNQSHLSD